MNYELYKQLKEAGFPISFSSEPGIGHFANLEARDVSKVYFTGLSLSELIEACGDDYGFGSLFRLGRKPNFGYIAESNISPIVKGVGDTPEEAVARLWLKLNKK